MTQTVGDRAVRRGASCSSRARSSGRIAFSLALLLLPGCTFFVRLAGGPSLDSDGHRGGVVALSIGGGIGSTRAAGSSPSYEQTFGVGPHHGALDKTLAVALRGYGSFGESARLGLGGHLGLVYGREPHAERGPAGLTIGAGFRLKLAGVTGRTSLGSCGPINDGDAWGLFLFQDVTYDRIHADTGRLDRVAFPFGVEFRMNSAPEFPSRHREHVDYAPDREPEGPEDVGVLRDAPEATSNSVVAGSP